MLPTDGDIEVFDMWEEGDGLQDVSFVSAGRQHFGFKLSTNANGDRVLGGDANGSVSFELTQICVGPGTVPMSIVIYIDATYIKHWIPIRPIYSELYDIIYDIIFIRVCAWFFY
jgi:hypothetical protein